MRLHRWLLVICTLVAMAASAAAQTQITTGVIEGVVTDSSNAVLPGVNVQAKNADTNLTREVVTDRDGRFSVLQLPSGRYTVTFSLSGFATLVQEEVTVTVGQATRLLPEMRVSGVAETVTVTSQAATVEVSRTAVASTLNQTTIENTPILGRKFEDLLTLTPGVSVVQGPDGDEISFSGQRGIFNNISLDGGDYNNGFFGEQMGGQRAAIDITLEAVKEFQVVANGANAEFGRTAGGVVNVITKSGTNQVRGSTFYFQRFEGLTANTSDGKPLTDFHREQFGATVGGPLVRDKAFFFGAFEGIREHLQRSNLSETIGAPCPVSNPTLAANEALINGSGDCQRLALLGFFRTRGQEEGLPVDHDINNNATLAKARLGAECRQQSFGLVQLRLLEEPQPDVRRGDVRQLGERDRGPIEDQHPQPESLQHGHRQQAERVPHHVLAGKSASLGDRLGAGRGHRHRVCALVPFRQPILCRSRTSTSS